MEGRREGREVTKLGKVHKLKICELGYLQMGGGTKGK